MRSEVALGFYSVCVSQMNVYRVKPLYREHSSFSSSTVPVSHSFVSVRRMLNLHRTCRWRFDGVLMDTGPGISGCYKQSCKKRCLSFLPMAAISLSACNSNVTIQFSLTFIRFPTEVHVLKRNQLKV